MRVALAELMSFVVIKVIKLRTDDMAQRITAPSTNPKDLDLIPSAHMV